MGRPPLNVKPTVVRLADDVKRRIVALVGENQMAAFIRDAVEAELRRREKRTGAPSRNQSRPAKRSARKSGPGGEA